LSNVADNGGDFGEDSFMDNADVVILDGGTGKSLEKITPKERRNELTATFINWCSESALGKAAWTQWTTWSSA
jgi:hypothetical protein